MFTTFSPVAVMLLGPWCCCCCMADHAARLVVRMLAGGITHCTRTHKQIGHPSLQLCLLKSLACMHCMPPHTAVFYSFPSSLPNTMPWGAARSWGLVVYRPVPASNRVPGACNSLHAYLRARDSLLLMTPNSAPRPAANTANPSAKAAYAVRCCLKASWQPCWLMLQMILE